MRLVRPDRGGVRPRFGRGGRPAATRSTSLRVTSGPSRRAGTGRSTNGSRWPRRSATTSRRPPHFAPTWSGRWSGSAATRAASILGDDPDSGRRLEDARPDRDRPRPAARPLRPARDTGCPSTRSPDLSPVRATYALRRALEAAPDDMTMLIALDDAYARRGMHEEALGVLDRLAELAARHPAAATAPAAVSSRSAPPTAAIWEPRPRRPGGTWPSSIGW